MRILIRRLKIVIVKILRIPGFKKYFTMEMVFVTYFRNVSIRIRPKPISVRLGSIFKYSVGTYNDR